MAGPSLGHHGRGSRGPPGEGRSSGRPEDRQEDANGPAAVPEAGPWMVDRCGATHRGDPNGSQSSELRALGTIPVLPAPRFAICAMDPHRLWQREGAQADPGPGGEMLGAGGGSRPRLIRHRLLAAPCAVVAVAS